MKHNLQRFYTNRSLLCAVLTIGHLCLSCTRCPSPPDCLPDFPSAPEANALLDKHTRTHWLYALVPSNRTQIPWFDLPHWLTWALFGNDDDGLFGEKARSPYQPSFCNCLCKALKWWVRNPFHNLTHYVIGSADRENGEWILLNLNPHRIRAMNYRPVGQQNYGCRCTSFLAAFHGGKPFLSLRIVYPSGYKTECYIGWRKEGNFGLKCVPLVNENRRKRHFSSDPSCKKEETREINFPLLSFIGILYPLDVALPTGHVQWQANKQHSMWRS